MSITGVVSDSFNIIKKNPVVLLPYLAFLVIVVIGALALGLGLVHQVSSMSGLGILARSAFSTAMVPALLHILVSILPSLAIFIIILCLIALLFIGAYLSMAKQIYSKKPVSMGDAFSESASRYWSLLGAFIVYMLIIGVITGVLGGIAYLASFSNLLAVVFLAVIWIILVIIAEIFLFQAYPLIIFEGKGALEAVKGSISIGEKNFWTILGIYVIMVILSFIIGIFRIIPILGGIIGLIGSWILATMGFFIPAVFYYTYVYKGNKPKTPKAKPKRRRPTV